MPLNYALIVFELVVMVLSISLHDCAQAWMANRLGDPTARMMGRMTMNPVRHFDLLGTLVWPVLFIFRSPLVLGWGKPITFTPRNFRNPSRDEMIATLAGPAAQLLAAVAALIALIVIRHAIPDSIIAILTAGALSMRHLGVSTEGLPSIFPVILFLYFCILVNLLLFVFNLIPLPFLDGGKILTHYLPYNAAKTYQSMSLYFMFGFFFLGFYVIQIFFFPVMRIFQTLLLSL
jgi:Zn-dependent protease